MRKSLLYSPLSIFLILLLSSRPFTASAQLTGTKTINLSEWLFAKSPSAQGERIIIPHSCNASDGQTATYYRGKTYYTRELLLNATQVQHQLFLLFEGAAQKATVSVNGKQVACHRGGYTPFIVPLQGIVQSGKNELSVICDNSEDVNLIPVSSDFNKNNGLHNAVQLLCMNDVYASPYCYGMYRMHVSTPQVSEAKALTQIETMIVNASAKSRNINIKLTLNDKRGKVCYRQTDTKKIEAGDSLRWAPRFVLQHPHLWNGIDDPYLYTAKISISDESGHLLDRMEAEVGYRFYRMDAEKGFFLNGHSYPLRGVSEHQDWDRMASAVDNAHVDTDYEIIKELGTNFIRLAHYPHHDYELHKCDELGIIVQTEIPWVNVCGVNAQQSYFDNIQQQMHEMIVNQYNHPSIVFWGLWNELDGWGNTDKLQGKADMERIVAETNKLYKQAKVLDPYRFVGVSDCSCFKAKGYDQLKLDYYSENRYNGWYYQKFEDFTREMTDIHQRMGITNVSEYGCGINPCCHTYDKSLIALKKNAFHYEDYGNLLHESHVRQIQKMPFLNFTSLWIMFDFPVASRMEGYMVSSDGVHVAEDSTYFFLNDKGLVSRNRRIKKDVFYLYKSLWNKKQTTVYITQRRQTVQPSDSLFDIKVYSNAKSLTLYQNDRKVCTMNSSGEETGVIWIFKNLKLEKAQDSFRVVASDGTSDTISFKSLNKKAE